MRRSFEHSFKITQQGANVNPPAYSLATLWLDGTIVDVAGSKYFVDKKAGNNVLITGYDFPTGWIKGFPYKSAATIDIFGQTAVPVISLFQNFDYNNQYFSKHAAQVVDVNGVETFEPRILEIVAYSAPLTDANLTAANTYFGVPEIVSGSKWIDLTNGSDTAPGDGTQAHPYKTHTKVDGLTLTEGTTVYVKTGTCAPIAWNKNYNLKAIGLVKILNVSGYRGIDHSNTGTLPQTIEGYIIDMNNVAGSSCVFGDLVNHTLTLNRVLFKNHANYSYQCSATLYNKIIYKNSIFTVNALTVYCPLSELDTCFIKQGTTFLWGNVANGSTTIKNSNINSISTSFINLYKVFNVTLIGNTYTNNSTLITFSNGNANAGTLSFTYNKFISTQNTVLLTAIRKGYTVIFNNNIVNYTAAATSILRLEVDVNQVHNNIIISEGGATLINGSTSTSDTKTYSIVGNTLVNKNKNTAYHIVVGTESTTANNNKVTACEIKNNNLWGYANYGAEVTVTHGFLVGFVADYDIRYNRSSGNYLGGVIKGGVNTGANICAYNIYENSSTGFWWKDAVACNFIGNTIDNCSVIYRMTQNSGGPGCSLMVLKNNIFNGTSTIINLAVSYNTDYNTYKTGIVINLDGVNKTLTEFKALGKDTNSNEQSITLNGDIPSPMISGTDLGSTYINGLGVLTNFGNDSTIPSIITNSQSATWQKGAYVQ